jgi:hypothetical protein
MTTEPKLSGNTAFYRDFIEYVGADLKKVRMQLHRRMLLAFLWCFIMPVLTAILVMVLVKFHVFPKNWGRHLDWLIVAFPVIFSIFILSSDVLKDLPSIMRRGGLSSALSRALQEETWRTRVCSEMRVAMTAHEASRQTTGWNWLVRTFRIDLQNMQYRTRYITALAGAVFFLLMQGIDALDEASPMAPTWQSTSLLSWAESSSNHVAQAVGLAFFLVLFYVSGSQAYYTLIRYLQCAELILLELDPTIPRSRQG